MIYVAFHQFNDNNGWLNVGENTPSLIVNQCKLNTLGSWKVTIARRFQMPL